LLFLLALAKGVAHLQGMKALFLALSVVTSAIAADAPVRLWSGEAPGEKGDLGEEKDTSQPGKNLVAGKPLIRLGNVSTPMLTVYRAPAEKATGAAVVVAPGGGYHILAYDLEGSEVCEWLNEQGVTAILLKYRVPTRKDRPRHEAPLQDAQRAISLTRQHAAEWGVDPNRIGVLGFSAGGHLAAVTCHAERAYPAADEADKLDCRPNFAVLVYPGYLAQKDKLDTLPPELPVSSKTPPTFIVMTMDDPVKVEGAFTYALAMKNAKAPCELHIYPEGGHGYGLRRTEKLVTTWPDRVADWMRVGGWLRK
jgi:acetyl esterase/lipase